MTTLCIGIIQRLDMVTNETQAVILTNDPETAKSFHRAIVALSKGMHIDVYLCIGENGEDAQVNQTPPHILIGTVESTRVAITRGVLDKSSLKIYCLDNGEQLLTYCNGKAASFGPAVVSIREWLPNETQVVVASSAIADDTVDVIKEIMNHSITIAVPEEADAGDNTRQGTEVHG